MLASGRALFPQAGCAGLSVRAVAEHAGVNPAMFHYHFASKDEFLRRLLQEAYEEMFASLTGRVQADGPAIERLRCALTVVAGFARTHRRLLARLWMDALAGEPVALAFFRDNGPRHLGVLFALLEQAQAEGAIAELPPVQRFAFVMGSVLLPMIFVSGLVESVAMPGLPYAVYEAQVMDDDAVACRIALALAALGAHAAPAPTAGPAPRRRAAGATPSRRLGASR